MLLKWGEGQAIEEVEIMRRHVIGAAVLLVVAAAAGQSTGDCPGCSPGSGVVNTGRWRVPIRTVEMKGDSVAVSLKQARGASWQLAACVKDGGGTVARLQVAELEMRAAGAGRPPLPGAIGSYENAEVSVKPGWVEVWARPASSAKKLVVYLELPKPATVELTVDERAIARALVTDSVYFADGELVRERVAGFAALLARAAFPVGARPAGIRRMGENEYFAPAAELVRNLVQFTRPARYPGLSLPDGSSISLLLTVGTDGQVREVVGIRGDPRLVAHCREAVLSWRFEPFLFQGSRVPVRSSVLMTVDARGDIGIPMLGAQ